LYFSFSSASFCTTFLSADIATSIAMHVLSFFKKNYYTRSICCNFSVCVYCFIPQHCDIFLLIHWLGLVCVCVCVYHLSAVSMPRVFHIE
jgi:hypothetical protein